MTNIKFWILSGCFALLPIDACFSHDASAIFTPDHQGTQVEDAIQNVITAYDQAEKSGVSAQALTSAQAVYEASFTWHKNLLTVCFWNGTSDLQEKVIDRATAWSRAADVHFSFKVGTKFRTCSDENSADIRISLDRNDKRHLYSAEDLPLSDWSEIGILSDNKKPRPKVSINLVRLPIIIDPTEFDFNIRHEFGHALGLMHEHQRDTCDNWFDYEEIAKDNPGWTIKTAKSAVASFRTEKIGGIVSFGPYDKNSIMQYNFLLNWYRKATPPAANPCERDNDVSDLSTQDIKGIQHIYGKPIATVAEQPSPAAPVAPPQNGHPDGLVSKLTPAEIKAHGDTLRAEADILNLTASVSDQLSIHVESAIVNKAIKDDDRCFDIFESKVCNTVSTPSSADGKNKLSAAANSASERSKKAANSLNELVHALDHLTTLTGGQ